MTRTESLSRTEGSILNRSDELKQARNELEAIMLALDSRLFAAGAQLEEFDVYGHTRESQ
jgi:hypothetical protein